MDLLRTFRNDVDECLTWLIVDYVACALGTDLTYGSEIINASNIMEKFGLNVYALSLSASLFLLCKT